MLWFWKKRKTPSASPSVVAEAAPPITSVPPKTPLSGGKPTFVRRHFYNERGFQTYGSFFPHWDGWLTAGHVLSEANHLLPPFASGDVWNWPHGLDASAIGISLPKTPPPAPSHGQSLIVQGYPAGSRHLEERKAKAYFERSPGVWIAHILMPDEPVVTGMSGGAVIDAQSGEPIGILITRNSPADLNSDRDPDESCDFVSLSAVWHAINEGDLVA